MPLVLSMMAATLLAAFGTMLALGTTAETAIAATFREGVRSLHAAEAAVEYAIGSLPSDGDWSGVPASSGFTDGPPAGTRTVGSVDIDLAHETQDVNALAQARSTWTTPRYDLYAYGRFADLVQTPGSPDTYVAVWIATIEERDPGAGPVPVVGLFARAYGPAGSRRSVAVAVTPGTDSEGRPWGVRTLWWYEVR